MKTKSPYGQIVVLKQEVSAECWNFTTGELFTLPRGSRLLVAHVNDATHTTCELVNEKGECPGIELTHADGTKQTGYRFIVGNVKLARATGLSIPRRTRDLVGEIMQYESGEASDEQRAKLFRKLKTSGLAGGLQGHYSSRM